MTQHINKIKKKKNWPIVNDPPQKKKKKKKKKKKQQIKTHDIYIDGSCDITRSKDNRVEK
jgi:hypothetical protein